MKKAFVTGWPISHSLSPAVHGFWLRRHKIAASYQAIAIEPGDFTRFFNSLPDSGYVGGNVTLPHKQAAFRLCAVRDSDADAIGAVNTLWLNHGKVHGGCSDAYGFAANLDEQMPRWRNSRSAIVLGAGGAARAVVHALRLAGLERIEIVNRTIERAGALAGDFGKTASGHGWQALPELLSQADLIINTTPLGMGNQAELQIDLKPVRQGAIITDIVYVPLETNLLVLARKRGLATVDGLGMLLHQAVPGFEKWFGLRPVVDGELRNHVVSLMAAGKRQ